MQLKKMTHKDSQGNTIAYEFFDSKVPPMQEIPHPGAPRGTDTVPAWLTPGEYVMNAEATRMFKPQIEAMNNAGQSVQRAQGGTIPEYQACGGKVKYHAGGAMVTEPTGMDEEYDPLIVTDPLSVPAPSAIRSPVVTEPTGLSPEEEEWLRLQRMNKLQQDYQEQMSNPAFRAIPEPAGIEYKASGGGIDRYVESLLGGFGNADDPYFFNDPRTLDAIAKTESGYNNMAESPVGAQGMYQWMPESIKDPGFGVKGGFNPQDPIAARAATQDYLKGIMEANPELNVNEAMQAYNWGIGNVKEFKEPTVPMRRPEMPVETQQYPGKVMDNYLDSIPPTGDVPVVTPYGNNVDPTKIPTTENELSSIEKAELAGVPIFGDAKRQAELEDMAKRIAISGEADQVVKEQIEKNLPDTIQVPVPEIAKRFDPEVSDVIKVDGAPPDIVGNTMKSIQDATKDSKTPTDTPDSVTKTGQEVADSNPEALSRVEQFMKDFGLADLIDQKELGRMAVMYLGSRALGYDHGGSINFAAKHYVQRVDAKTANKQAIAKAAMKDYTSESIKKYLDSGDISDLKLKVTTDFSKDFKVFDVDGKKVNGYWDDTAQKFYARTSKGNIEIPPNTPIWKDDTSVEDYSKWKGDLESDLNAIRDDMFPAGKTPELGFMTGGEMANATARYFEDQGFNVKNASVLAQMNQIAMSATRMMGEESAKNKDKKYRIEPFLARATAEAAVGTDYNIFMLNPNEDNIADQEFVAAGKIMKVMEDTKAIAANDAKNAVEARAIQARLITKAKHAWTNMTKDQQMKYSPNADENGFYVFLNSIINDQVISPEEEKLLNPQP